MLTEGRKIQKIPKEAPVFQWPDFMGLGRHCGYEYRVKRNPDDPAAILYSGGTTGTTNRLELYEPENDEIKEWILYEGIKNNVHPGYSAIRCFQKADVHTRLENGLKQEELTPVGMILMFLIEDGPTIGIEAFEDGDNMIDRYLDSAEKLELSETDRQIIEFISKNYDNDTICQRCKSLLP